MNSVPLMVLDAGNSRENDIRNDKRENAAAVLQRYL